MRLTLRWLVAAAVLAGLVLAAPAASAATIDTNTWYVLVNRNSGKALDVYNLATNDGARITQWTRNDGNQQQWQFVDSGGGNYRLKSRLSGKVLDVSGNSTADGAAIVQWTDNNAGNQQFSVQDIDGYIQLIGRNSGKALEVQGASTADGGNIVQYSDWNGTNQQWQLVPAGTTPPPAGGSFTNPVVWQDFADGDIVRVGDAYYYSASTMHYSPGAPILRSYDLVNWEYAGHSVPRLDFDSAAYDLSGSRAYVKGIWASAFNYRPSDATYYWLGCTEFNRTYVYASTAIGGDWAKKARINKCYYDAGLLFDGATPYVAYGNGTISVAQLSADLSSEVRSQTVYTTPSSIGTLEGSRMYKRGNYYYIWLTRPANGQYVLRSTSPWGPYEQRQVLLNLPGPISGGGVPHQGGLVQTQNGDWWYMAFTDAYPGGRMPTLAPITWSSDGWPVLQTVNGRWGATYPKPAISTTRTVQSMIGPDTFTGPSLSHRWEWNHNPDTSKFTVGNGLRLSTATVTNDLYNARNTLTHRIQGPTSTATIQLNYASMANGDRAGLAMLRDQSAWIGVRKDNGATRVSMTNGLSMSTSGWGTTGTGSEAAGAPISGGTVWLRVTANIQPGSGRTATFSYSTNGSTFTTLGPAFVMNNDWQFFMGYRFGLFNYATSALGGAVTVNRFDLTAP
ncbi:family 43 glycosylhydrolase [Paractinoplanes atraurantiacus]|uniref:Beta-xylosidase n=1 Tax=Paractinoplanes atraurantiacus TaxID=1036182 RepID=A0A285KP98_9ACTN|nr:family 43 glycosylhydrolase [Actinoplanes atraurantiacus]SNY74033.1 Beta-xylosidase [Actinoplanes atraurantiacus]